MAEIPTPISIRLDKPARRLIVNWSDGFQMSYPWELLRANCPSAGERAAREETNPLAVLKAVPSSDIVSAKLVGSYAINFTWSDGHDAGIYTWEYLRELAQDSSVVRLAIV
jgi:DUF971 family protein